MNYLLLSSTEFLNVLNSMESGLASANNSVSVFDAIVVFLAGIFGIGVSAMSLIIPIFFIFVGIIWSIIEYLLPAVALYKMASKAGYKYPWLAFIPVAQTYLEYVLPRREFNLIFKTKNRSVMGIIALTLTYFGSAIIVALNILPAIGQILDLLLPFVLTAFSWRKKYDMIRTFADKELAIAVSIISIPFPFIYSVFLVILMNKEPEYGAGRYYDVYMQDF